MGFTLQQVNIILALNGRNKNRAYALLSKTPNLEQHVGGLVQSGHIQWQSFQKPNGKEVKQLVLTPTGQQAAARLSK